MLASNSPDAMKKVLVIGSGGAGKSTILDKMTVHDADIAGKTVLVRVDFNVPFRPGTTEISDDSRIRASLPTIRYLADRQCRVVLCSHLGRPKGAVAEGLRISPVSERLSQVLGADVAQAPDCIGPEVEELVDGLEPGEVAMLENLRFHPGEEGNDPVFARALAGFAEMYVNDAFGAAHRAHASTEGVTRHLPSVAGLLMTQELRMLGGLLKQPARPFVAVLGGAKVSGKIDALQNLADRVDTMIVGGGMAATFLKTRGLEVGESLVEDDRIPVAQELLRADDKSDYDMLLPVDVVVAEAFSAEADHKVVEADQIPPTWRIMDIGPRTAAAYERALERAKTVVWNGPMGVNEWAPFAQGTARIARAIAALDGATTVVGGGSTAEAVNDLGLDGKMSHVSTGGGASLELLGGRTLPGVAALMDVSAATV